MSLAVCGVKTVIVLNSKNISVKYNVIIVVSYQSPEEVNCINVHTRDKYFKGDLILRPRNLIF